MTHYVNFVLVTVGPFGRASKYLYDLFPSYFHVDLYIEVVFNVNIYNWF